MIKSSTSLLRKKYSLHSEKYSVSSLYCSLYPSTTTALSPPLQLVFTNTIERQLLTHDVCLTHFMLLVSLYTPWKYQKNWSFLCFQGVWKETSGIKWAKSNCVKVSIFGVFLVRIFLYLDWMRTDREYLSVFSPNAGK